MGYWFICSHHWTTALLLRVLPPTPLSNPYFCFWILLFTTTVSSFPCLVFFSQINNSAQTLFPPCCWFCYICFQSWCFYCLCNLGLICNYLYTCIYKWPCKVLLPQKIFQTSLQFRSYWLFKNYVFSCGSTTCKKLQPQKRLTKVVFFLALEELLKLEMRKISVTGLLALES